ncbi:MAG: hypothetical protein ABJH63_10625 [Rhizobiaceae bacterium]
MSNEVNRDGIDWVKAEEVWFNMGDNRSVKRLRQYLRSAQKVVISQKDLTTKLEQRDLFNKARHFDRQVNSKVSALHREEFSEELHLARVESIRKIAGIYDDVLEATADFMRMGKEQLKRRNFDPSTFNSLVNGATKLNAILENSDPGQFMLAARDVRSDLSNLEGVEREMNALTQLKRFYEKKDDDISPEEMLSGEVVPTIDGEVTSKKVTKKASKK